MAKAQFKVGDRVQYLAGGKVARLEGKAGEWCKGFVTDVSEDAISVLPDHRASTDCDMFKGMQASCDPKRVRLINDQPASVDNSPSKSQDDFIKAFAKSLKAKVEEIGIRGCGGWTELVLGKTALTKRQFQSLLISAMRESNVIKQRGYFGTYELSDSGTPQWYVQDRRANWLAVISLEGTANAHAKVVVEFGG